MLIFFSILCLVLDAALLFLPGKNGRPSVWHDFTTRPISTDGFIWLFMVIIGLPGFLALLTHRYAWAAFPSDQTLQCDSKTLTYSRVRWFDFTNKDWITCTYAVSELAEFQYRSLGSSKGTSIYGLTFLAEGKVRRALPGLKPHQADRVLKGLKSLGADVPDDLVLKKKLEDEAASLGQYT